MPICARRWIVFLTPCVRLLHSYKNIFLICCDSNSAKPCPSMQVISLANDISVFINSYLSTTFIPRTICINCSIGSNIHTTYTDLHPFFPTAKSITYPRCCVRIYRWGNSCRQVDRNSPRNYHSSK